MGQNQHSATLKDFLLSFNCHGEAELLAVVPSRAQQFCVSEVMAGPG